MTTPSASALQPARAPRIAVLPVALVFIVGTTIGTIVAASAINFSQADGGTDVPAAVTSNTELARLLGNMDAAAARGDVRLLLALRQDLVELIGAAGVAEYEAVRGVDRTGHYGPGYPLHGGLAGATGAAISNQAGSFAPGYPLHGGLAGATGAAISNQAGSFAPGYPLHGGLAGPGRVDSPTIHRGSDPTRHLKYRNEPPPFQWSDNSGGI